MSCTVAFAIAIIALGGWLTYACRWDLFHAWKSPRWPTTPGWISGTVVYEGTALGSATDGTNAPTMAEFRMKEWVFRYEVAGQHYSSTQFSFSTSGWRENDRFLQEGDEVKVYYCPSNPSVAVLRPGLNAGLLAGPMVLFFGVMALALGGVAWP
ncbi:MAG: DUF3592 domain-containing protein [Verrucomicrobiales bacterium]|nr:DUF3592 domain-containing protein [Verrucomicrobiales bacterium]